VGATLPREKVLYLIWREPWMTVAQGTYIAATLAAVGWDTCPASASPVTRLSSGIPPWLPEVQRVFLSSEPYRFREQHVDEVGRLSGLPASLIDGEMASWYGSRAIEGLRHLAALRRSLAAE
jgi:hypothetical protein